MPTDKELFEMIKDTYSLNPSDEFVIKTDALLRQQARKVSRKRTVKRWSIASSGMILGTLALVWFLFFNGYDLISSLRENHSTADIASNEPTIYIYHTHNDESFAPEIQVTDPIKAFDTTKNITLVGSRLLKALQENNISALQDGTDIMGIMKKKGLSSSDSYEVSREPLLAALDKHQTIKMVIDLHRDSRKRDMTTKKIDGLEYARIAFIVSGSTPNYKENVKLANELHNQLEANYPGLSSGVLVKSQGKTQSTYNQDLFDGSILLEIGGVENTLEEEYRSAEVLAKIIKFVIDH